MRHNFLLPPKAPKLLPLTSNVTIQPEPNTNPSWPTLKTIVNGIFMGYLSDQSEDQFNNNEHFDNVDLPLPINKPGSSTPSTQLPITFKSFLIHPPPPPKQQKLDIPACTVHHNAQEVCWDQFKKALTLIKNLIILKHNVFQSGKNGLQAYHCQAVQSCLQMVVKQQPRANWCIAMCCREPRLHREMGRKVGTLLGTKLGGWEEAACVVARTTCESLHITQWSCNLCWVVIICSVEKMVHEPWEACWDQSE